MKNIATYRPYFASNEAGRPEIRILATARDSGLPETLHAFRAPIQGMELSFRSMGAGIERLVENAPTEGDATALFLGSSVEEKQFNIENIFSRPALKTTLEKMNDGIASTMDILAACHNALEREITPFYPDACLSFGDGSIRVESRTALAARMEVRTRSPSGLSTARRARNLHVWI